MTPDKIVLDECIAELQESWRPRVLATLNGQEVKLARLDGPFVWHHHAAEDELFLVLRGKLAIELAERTVELAAGELFVVPRGVEHRPVADGETYVLLFEPAGVRNTGNVDHPVYTARSAEHTIETPRGEPC
jgi:mannose-6-phosphate isomerase-like protein (cupin superfamily)